jgi:hypothetical protein
VDPTFFGGVSPKDMVYKPIEMKNVIAPPPPQPSRITLGGILSKFNIPGLKTPTPVPTLPSKSVFPPTTYKNAFQPALPIPAKH